MWNLKRAHPSVEILQQVRTQANKKNGTRQTISGGCVIQMFSSQEDISEGIQSAQASRRPNGSRCLVL